MADIIDMTKLAEAREAAEATARLHEALCIAADETATGALCTEGRARLIAALVPAIGPGWRLSWSPAMVAEPKRSETPGSRGRHE